MIRDNEARENSANPDRQRIRDTVELADGTLINDASLETLEKRLRAVLSSLKEK